MRYYIGFTYHVFTMKLVLYLILITNQYCIHLYMPYKWHVYIYKKACIHLYMPYKCIQIQMLTA